MANSWIFFCILWIVLRLVFLQTFKHTVNKTKNEIAMLVVVQTIAALTCACLIPAFKWELPTDWLVWLLLIVSLFLYAISDRLNATTRKYLDITTDTSMNQSYRLLFFGCGILFLGRSFTWGKLVGGFIVVAATVLAVFENGKFTWNRYIFLKILTIIAFTAAMTLDAYNSANFNLPFYVFISLIVPVIFMLIGRQAKFKHIAQELKRKDSWLLVLNGIVKGGAAFVWLYLMNRQRFGNVFIEITSVTAVHVVLNVFFAYIFLKERNNLAIKIFSAIFVVLGIVVITVS